jgi:acetoin utilization deacetylase AcuC-like enzyme
MAPVLVISSGEVGLAHDTGPGHPERAERLEAVERGIDMAGRLVELRREEGRDATTSEIEAVHDPAYIRRIRTFIAEGGRAIDADTRVCRASWAAGLRAAGAGLAAVEALERGDAATAFVAVRPPGHHATSRAAMGFCLINNVAVTAARLAANGQRVAVVDWDVHHGNGTEEIFWDRPDVLYISTHQRHLYPGTGRYDATGGPSSGGTVVNVPLPSGATGDAARAALQEVAAPEIERFGPDWVLISAGFDAHRADPLAGLEWSSGDYADLTTLASEWAPAPGRTIAWLEGGYDLDALTDSTVATITALGGEPHRPEPQSNGGPGLEQVRQIAQWRAEQVWRN